MKKIIVILLLFITINHGFAQTIPLPDDKKYETQKDFDKNEELIITCIDWYLSEPLTVQPDFRDQAKTFIWLWVSENPGIDLTINTDILEPVLTDEGYVFNDQIIFSYLCGMTKFVIQNREKEYDEVEVQYTGLKAALLLLQKNKTILSDSKGLAAYVSLENKKELHNWVANILVKATEE